MRKYITYSILLALISVAFSVNAQEDLSKTPKAAKVATIEKDIQAFINENIGIYDLTQERVQQVIIDFSRMERSKMKLLPKALNQIKRTELRELYFAENPDAASYFTMRLLDDPVYICDNGGFEEGTDEYYFTYDDPTSMSFICDMDTSALMPETASATIDDFSANVTLVDVGYDPVLNALSPPIQIDRVRTGNTAIKLNNNDPLYGVTSMSKVFTVDSPQISYSFSLIVENPLNHPDYDQPHFIVRLYDMDDNVLGQNCIIADVTNTLLFNNADNDPDQPLIYTGWQCGILSTEGVPYGNQLRIEFIITDCGQGAHYGTVYIDDICSSDDCQTAYGRAELYDNTKVNCPAFPINACGSFLVPHSINTDPVIYGTLSTLVLNVLDSSNNIVATLTTPTITGNEFCFELNDTDFSTTPSGDYEFQAVATFSIGGEAVVSQDLSANAGPDMSFNDCSDECDPCIAVVTDVATLVTDNQQARECITAYNTVNDDAVAIYHAGKDILLSHDPEDGNFEALYGSVGHFYITGCTDTYNERSGIVKNKPSSFKSIDLIAINADTSKLKIYPNPATASLNVDSGQAKIKAVSLTSLDGKLVMQQQPGAENNRNLKLDVHSLSSGIYILTVETNDGTITTHKIVRE